MEVQHNIRKKLVLISFFLICIHIIDNEYKERKSEMRKRENIYYKERESEYRKREKI